MTAPLPSWLTRLAAMTPRQLARLSPSDRAELAAALDAHERRAEALLDFVPRISPGYMRPTHLAPIAAALQSAEHGAARRILNAPPRHAKTELLLHFVAWFVRRNPRKTVGYVTYSGDLAHSKSRLARDYARRAGVVIRDDADTMHEWRTPEGGGCLAAGAQGSWTGQGVDVLLIDDPYKDRRDAESPLIRARVVQFYQSVANTRIEPGGSIFVTHTRWHERDLSGWIKAESEDGADYGDPINLPALDAAGVALWPARWSADDLEKKRRGVGPYDWAALYLGAPIPKGGQVFRAPTYYELNARGEADLAGARILIGCDPAGSEATDADYTAAVVLAVRGEDNERTADVLDVLRVHGETAKVAAELEATQRRWRAPLTIEATRDGKALHRALALINPRLVIEEAVPYASKFVRAQPAAGAWNEGRIRVPREAPWLDEFLYEFSRFTGLTDAHDDQVDALAYAWNAAAVPPRFVSDDYLDR
jgi:predicted phage terminase large subunit-like protein